MTLYVNLPMLMPYNPLWVGFGDSPADLLNLLLYIKEEVEYTSHRSEKKIYYRVEKKITS
jgi:hypothetical protein